MKYELSVGRSLVDERSSTLMRCRSSFAALIFAVMLSATCLTTLATAQVPPKYLGGGITAGMNFHDLYVPIYRNDTMCGVFLSGNSILPTGFLTFEMPLGEPASSLWIAPRIHFGGLGALISAPDANPSNASDPITHVEVPSTIVHRLDATILDLGADLFVKYPFTPRLFLFGGPSLIYLLKRDVTETTVLTDPPSRAGTTINYSGQIPNSNSVIASATLGGSLDMPLSEKVMLAPELSVTVPINGIRSDYRWRVTTVSLGASIKFNIAKEPKPPEIVKVDTTPPPPERPRSEITARVKISGVGIDSTGAEVEMPEPQLRVEEFVRQESYPTLSYVFFDSGSSSIPDRYHKIIPDSAAAFNPVSSLSGHTSMEVYDEMLNILGKRLNDSPSIKITITGTTDGKEPGGFDLAKARAESVKQYLVSAWNIDPKRMKTDAMTLPRNASAADTKEGAEENRRVEITSSDANFLDPLTAQTIDRTMNPPKIRLRTSLQSRLPLKKNTLLLHQGSRGLVFFNSAQPVQDWHPSEQELPRGDTAMVATLDVTDTNGAMAEASDTAHLEQITIQKKRQERVKDKIIERYNLITFDFDKADLDVRSQHVIADIVRSITPNDKIQIRGYTDITGERTHNLQLSEARAKAVESALKSALGARASTVSFQTQGEGQLNLVDNRLPEGRFLSRTVFVQLEKPVE